MKNGTIVIDGIRYHADRPASCRACYFWKNRKVGCTLGKVNHDLYGGGGSGQYKGNRRSAFEDYSYTGSDSF